MFSASIVLLFRISFIVTEFKMAKSNVKKNNRKTNKPNEKKNHSMNPFNLGYEEFIKVS